MSRHSNAATNPRPRRATPHPPDRGRARKKRPCRSQCSVRSGVRMENRHGGETFDEERCRSAQHAVRRLIPGHEMLALSAFKRAEPNKGRHPMLIMLHRRCHSSQAVHELVGGCAKSVRSPCAMRQSASIEQRPAPLIAVASDGLCQRKEAARDHLSGSGVRIRQGCRKQRLPPTRRRWPGRPSPPAACRATSRNASRSSGRIDASTLYINRTATVAAAAARPNPAARRGRAAASADDPRSRRTAARGGSNQPGA